ncbi:unnamed protein product [marine sediment metagenome]|uniref:Uncharacterized protein n=1 Tax=marine sediment metagenome TaxID=412755 RepID=X1LMP9_9ZZZZ
MLFSKNYLDLECYKLQIILKMLSPFTRILYIKIAFSTGMGVSITGIYNKGTNAVYCSAPTVVWGLSVIDRYS